MPRTVPADSDDVTLDELVDEVTDGEAVQLTRRGRLAAVMLSTDAYDRLVLAAGTDARRELGELAAQTREAVRAAGWHREMVDDAIAAVRAERA